MTQNTIAVTAYTNATVGLDLGDNRTEFCVLGTDRNVLERGSVATTRGALARLFGRFRRTRIALEVCGQSAWISRLAKASGNNVIVADSRRLPLISSSQQKNDRNDAELLARLARADLQLLNPI
jgi:transposase